MILRYLLLFIILVVTTHPVEVTYGDNCGSLQDCYNTIAVAVVVLAAIVIAVMLFPIIIEVIGAIATRAAAGIAARWAAAMAARAAARAAAEAVVTDVLAGAAAETAAAGAAAGGVATQILGSTTAQAAGQRLLQAGEALARMAMSAQGKVDVMKNIIEKLGMRFSGFKDAGGSLWMYSEDFRYAFQFVKDTGQILYGKFDSTVGQFGDYVWRAL